MRTANPALSDRTFATIPQTYGGQPTMTLAGSANKTLALLLILVASAAFTWQQTLVRETPPTGLMLLGLIGGFIVAMVTIFKQSWAPVTAPLYALLEGLFLGAISALANRYYPNIVPQAVALTFGILFCLLVAYRSGLIPVTENFRLGVVAATGAVALIYLVTFVLGFFGVRVPFIHEGGRIGILFSLAVIVIASLNLVLDFDFIEDGARRGLPGYMEWYAGFGLLVTLVWLYLEILNLLMKLSGRSDD